MTEINTHQNKQAQKVLFLGIFFFSVFVVGIGTGYPAIEEALADAGIFSALCEAKTKCASQEVALGQVGNAGVAGFNAFALIAGILVDYFGWWKTFHVTNIIWTLAFSLQAFNPKIGYVFAVCYVLYSVCQIVFFLITVSNFTKPTMLSEDYPALPNALITGGMGFGNFRVSSSSSIVFRIAIFRIPAQVYLCSLRTCNGCIVWNIHVEAIQIAKG